jgi:hypothetical protein
VVRVIVVAILIGAGFHDMARPVILCAVGLLVRELLIRLRLIVETVVRVTLGGRHVGAVANGAVTVLVRGVR